MNEKKRVPASPKTRKFARELGVNINLVLGSQRDGRVVEEDIKKFVKHVGQEKNTQIKNEFKTEFTHSDFGEIEIKDIPRVKKIAAVHLSHAWNTIPHVTNHDEADVTDMENFRNSLKDLHTGEKKKITPLAFITKALVATLKKFPFRVDGSKCFGPGIFDMKSGNLIAMEAVKMLMRKGDLPNLKITILITSDEEIGSPSTRSLIESESLRSKYVLVPEPGLPDGGYVSGRYAIARFNLKTEGVRCKGDG